MSERGTLPVSAARVAAVHKWHRAKRTVDRSLSLHPSMMATRCQQLPLLPKLQGEAGELELPP